MLQTAKEKNLAFFNQKLSELLSDPLYTYKFVVIHGEQIKGSYDTFSAALEFAVGNFPQEEFVIQQVLNQADQINFLRSAI